MLSAADVGEFVGVLGLVTVYSCSPSSFRYFPLSVEPPPPVRPGPPLRFCRACARIFALDEGIVSVQGYSRMLWAKMLVFTT